MSSTWAVHRFGARYRFRLGGTADVQAVNADEYLAHPTTLSGSADHFVLLTSDRRVARLAQQYGMELVAWVGFRTFFKRNTDPTLCAHAIEHISLLKAMLDPQPITSDEWDLISLPQGGYSPCVTPEPLCAFSYAPSHADFYCVLVLRRRSDPEHPIAPLPQMQAQMHRPLDPRESILVLRRTGAVAFDEEVARPCATPSFPWLTGVWWWGLRLLLRGPLRTPISRTSF